MMRNFIFILHVIALMLFFTNVKAEDKGKPKALVICVDGLLSSAIDYASTEGIDQLVENATYNLQSFGTLPSYSTTSWATILTGSSVNEHGVDLSDSFEGNNFSEYPSMITRLENNNSSLQTASVVRDAMINNQLNHNADVQFSFSSDEEVVEKGKELLSQNDLDFCFVQLSSPKEVGVNNGFLLRSSNYIRAVQAADQQVKQLVNTVKQRTNYIDENWVIFFASSHGGTELGSFGGFSTAETTVPIILSGNEMDNKLYEAESLDPTVGGDNFLGINQNGDEISCVKFKKTDTPLEDMGMFTIEMWIKAGENSSDPSIIGDKDWGSGGNQGYTICRSGSSWKLNIANQNGERQDIYGSTIEDNNWHHLAVTFNKTKECYIYQDGKQVNYQPLSYKENDTFISPFEYFALSQEGTLNYGGSNWEGQFNEVRIWKEVLSKETIINYMNARNVEQVDHPNLSSLVFYLKMDNVDGSILQDSGPNAIHGEFVGSNLYRKPLYALKLADLHPNILNHFSVTIDSSWGLTGTVVSVSVPYRLFKVN